MIGRLASIIMKWGQAKGIVDHESFIVQFVAVALFTTGVTTSLGVDDLLAAFAAGVALAWDGHFAEQIHHELFGKVLDFLLNSVGFIYIGAWLEFSDFNMPELGISPARLLALFLGILVLRRIPAMIMLYKFIPDIHSWHEALFCGHFGPMGVGALFVATFALESLKHPEGVPETQEELLAVSLHPIVSFIVLGSIFVRTYNVLPSPHIKACH